MHDAHVTKSDPETVVYVTMNGPRSRVPEALGRASDFVEHYGLVVTGAPQVLHLTTPETDEQISEWELWLPIAGGAGDVAADEEPVGVKRIESDTVAAGQVESDEFVGAAYRELEVWARDNGLTPVGPPLEVYSQADQALDSEKHGTEIRFPVQVT